MLRVLTAYGIGIEAMELRAAALVLKMAPPTAAPFAAIPSAPFTAAAFAASMARALAEIEDEMNYAVNLKVIKSSQVIGDQLFIRNRNRFVLSHLLWHRPRSRSS